MATTDKAARKKYDFEARFACSKAAAIRDAKNIESYWRDAGYNGILCTVYRQIIDDRYVYSVKTNLDHRGLPPSHPGETL
jgi:hypothetical protein